MYQIIEKWLKDIIYVSNYRRMVKRYYLCIKLQKNGKKILFMYQIIEWLKDIIYVSNYRKMVKRYYLCIKLQKNG